MELSSLQVVWGVSMKRVMRHIGALHAHEAGFHICCGIAGCSRTYKNFASFQKHLYRIHRDVLEIDAKVLYPTCPIIPKMHYMVHYPEAIDK